MPPVVAARFAWQTHRQGPALRRHHEDLDDATTASSAYPPLLADPTASYKVGTPHPHAVAIGGLARGNHGPWQLDVGQAALELEIWMRSEQEKFNERLARREEEVLKVSLGCC